MVRVMYLVLRKVVMMVVVSVEGFQIVVVVIASTGVVMVDFIVLTVGRQVLPVLHEEVGGLPYWP